MSDTETVHLSLSGRILPDGVCICPHDWPDARFPLGRVLATPGVLESDLTVIEVAAALKRHASGDWGNLAPCDEATNDVSLADGARLLSAYSGKDGTKFWIITEADRSATTLLLPGEY